MSSMINLKFNDLLYCSSIVIYFKLKFKCIGLFLIFLSNYLDIFFLCLIVICFKFVLNYYLY